MKKTSMFELLNERMEKEDIVKLVGNYDNKFNELEKENKQLKSQLQQKEDIIKEVREYCKNDDNFHILDLYSQDIVDGIQQELLEILDKENI